MDADIDSLRKKLHDFKTTLVIDPQDLSNEISNNSRFVYAVGALRAQLECLIGLSELEMNAVFSEIFEIFYKKSQKQSVAEIETKGHRRYLEARQAWLMLSKDYALADALFTAVKSRSFDLKTLVEWTLAEMKHTP